MNLQEAKDFINKFVNPLLNSAGIHDLFVDAKTACEALDELEKDHLATLAEKDNLIAECKVDIATYRRRLIDMEGSRDHWKGESEKKDKEIALWKQSFRAADKDNIELREENAALIKDLAQQTDLTREAETEAAELRRTLESVAFMIGDEALK